MKNLLCIARSSGESAALQTKMLPPTYEIPLSCSAMSVLNQISRCLGQVTSFRKFAFFFSYCFLHSVSHPLTCLHFISYFSLYILFISAFAFLLRLFYFSSIYLINTSEIRPLSISVFSIYVYIHCDWKVRAQYKMSVLLKGC